MSDAVKGIAVLDDRGAEECLFVVCCPTAGRNAGMPFIQRIAAHRKGTPKTRNPEWEYEERDGRLHITPSLHVFTTYPPDTNERETLFHNGYNWDVVFVRWSDTGMKDEALHGGRWTYCSKLNAALLSG